MKKYNKPALKKYGHLRNVTFSRDSDYENATHKVDVKTGEITMLTEGEMERLLPKKR